MMGCIAYYERIVIAGVGRFLEAEVSMATSPFCEGVAVDDLLTVM